MYKGERGSRGHFEPPPEATATWAACASHFANLDHLPKVPEEAKRDRDEGSKGSGKIGGIPWEGVQWQSPQSPGHKVGAWAKGGTDWRGGGNRELMASKEDSCAVGIGSRVLGLVFQTSPPKGARRYERAGVDTQQQQQGAEAFINWPRVESGELTTSRRKENITHLTRVKG